MKISLFLPDFRSLVNGTFFTSSDVFHNVFYYETSEKIYFYKPIGSVLYCVELIKQDLPDNISVDELKQEFRAIEIPKEISISSSTTFIQGVG